ncbi:MAG TPA: archease [Thermoanaerobaculia bacterium]|nr:archease [Thermoanaerobaculia bacterium]
MFTVDEHTADVRVTLDSASPEELFSDALASLMFVLGASTSGGEEAERRIEVESSNRTNLLIDFLNEVLGLAFVHGEMYHGMRLESLTEQLLVGTLFATEATLADEVKAVTYHEAEVKQQPDGRWSTTLVFDL